MAPLDSVDPELGYLSTKRIVPQAPPRLIERERLLAGVDDALARHPVVLLRAPAGSGKTALLSAWARSGNAPGPVAWLSLNAHDSNRGRFWRQVFMSIAETGVSERIARLAIPTPDAVEALLATMLTALSDLDRPVVLVLDDLHEIDDEQIMADLGQLLRAPSPGLRLVISSRSDPPLRLQRLRLAGGLGELPQDDLVFRLDEAQSLFAANGVDLAAGDAERLWTRTEGWAAGLALTAITLRTRPDTQSFIDEFAGDVAPVADYLLEEVLADQPPRVRSFLLATSILSSVCGDLADAVTGDSGSAVLLERLHHGGVLTSAMDHHREWYRYHGLLRDLMHTVLRREEPDAPRVLNRRAAQWYADHDFPIPAARHAVEAGDLEFLTELTATRVFNLLAQGEIGALAAILRRLPADELQANSVLALTLAGAALEVGDVDRAISWTGTALAHQDAVPEHHRETFETGLAIVRLYQARIEGNIEGALEAARSFVPDPSSVPVHGANDQQALALVTLGALELWLGDPEAARREIQRGLAIGRVRGRWYLCCDALAHDAVLRMWTGDHVGAEASAREALEIAETHGWGATPRAGMALTVLSVGAMVQGRLEDAQVLLDQADVGLRSGLELPLRAHTEVHRARLARMRGNPTEALTILERVRCEVEGTAFMAPLHGVLAMEQALSTHAVGRTQEALALLSREAAAADTGEIPVTLAGLHLECGDPDAALELLTPWIGSQLGSQLVSTQVRAFLFAARAHRERGDAEAAPTLERALALAEPDARRMPFLEQGPEFAETLEAHTAGGSAYGAFAVGIRELLVGQSEPASERSAVDDLSSRELEVLRFLPTMLTNREIAEELIVSVNTVKTHLKQIYGKLGAHDRRDAVRRARALGLL